MAWRVLLLLVAHSTVLEARQTSTFLGSIQLRRMSTKAQALNNDVCKATPGQCTVYQFSKAGFGSNMNGLLLAIACYGKGDIVMDMQALPYQCGDASGLESLFYMDINPEHSLPDKKCQVVEYNNAHHALMAEDPKVMFSRLGEAALRVWRLTPEMQIWADKMTDFMNLFHSNEAGSNSSRQSATLAVHVRGGDKVTESSLTSADWYQKSSGDIIIAAQNILGEDDVIKTCIVFGDDLLAGSHVLMALAKHFKCTGVQVGGSFAGFDKRTFNKGSKESKCHETKKMIAEIHAMSTADYFLGSYSSNVPRLVHVLRSFVYGKDASTSGDIWGTHEWTHNCADTHYNKPSS